MSDSLKVVIGLLIVVALGVASPEVLISDGVARFAGEKQMVAEDALLWAKIGCNEPVDRLLRRQFRVTEVTLAGGVCPTRDVPAYRAKVRTYTFFMIPTGTISVRCSSISRSISCFD